ncbi:hypothetical protein R1flu_007404 [Riccia fluitans]|uniref:Reverse transcriptase Ty1/copia-type domain-containing protein n=1 Tax=Riccia fluitans TaxID=41844 RepID=A0ABD1YZ10_9MARC
MVMALAAKHDWEVEQMDVDTAFLNGELQEEIYMKQPPGFVVEGLEDKVCRLRKAIYGLKQASRAWYTKFDACLQRLGFIESSADENVYIRKGTHSILIVLLYVDDMLIVGNNMHLITQLKGQLGNLFKMKDLGAVQSFLAIKVDIDMGRRTIRLSQSSYVQTLLERIQMSNCKPCSLPIDPNLKLFKEDGDSVLTSESKVPYRKFMSCLLYLMACTRPDICYAIITLSQFNDRFQEEHWSLLKRVVRYLQGTKDKGLVYSSDGKYAELTAVVDAAFGNNVNNRSTTGCCFYMYGGAISWMTKKQGLVTISIAKAEYVALSVGVRKLVKYARLLEDLFGGKVSGVQVLLDSQSAMKIAGRPNFRSKTVHIPVHYHFVREKVDAGFVVLQYVASADLVADIFTKALPFDSFSRHCTGLGLVTSST